MGGHSPLEREFDVPTTNPVESSLDQIGCTSVESLLAFQIRAPLRNRDAEKQT